VLTDGYVSVEKEAYTLVRKRLGEANLFAFGIGTAVNRELIEILARAGAGDAFVAVNLKEARQAARRYRQYVSEPLLSNVEATFKGFDVRDEDPVSIPDLFSERPIVIHGKYKGDLKGEIVITGTRGATPYRAVVPVERTAADEHNRSLAYLFARSRIRTLSDEAYLDGGSAAKGEITRLGLEYGLMTPYTSFVAVDKVKRNSGGANERVKQPSPMPAGVSDAAIGVDPDMALGALMGSTVGDQYGYGGLGLQGSATGGGGAGSGIGLGNLGTIGHGSGGGSGGAGYDRGAGGLGARRAERAPMIKSGAAMVKGNLSKEVIRRIVHRHLNELKACYNALLSANPGLSGKVVVRFTITQSGAVAAVAVTESTMNDKKMEECLVTAIEQWQFPKVEGGGIVVVTYPFVFEIPQ
jgi:Ca-activated chloride channel family protein